jgi:NitT/TauT family transport system substrate-binding protein
MVVFVFSLFAGGCSGNSASNNNAKPKIKVAALKGPTGIGMVKLMESYKSDYDISVYDSADQIVSKVVKGEVDVAAVPSNIASVLYNKTKKNVKLAGINTLGVLYVVQNGNSVKSIGDLKGKTVYASGKGSVPEFAFNYILEQNGLDPQKDVDINYKMSHSDLSAAVASKKVDIAVLPEPFVTTTKIKDKDLNVALDLTKEWDKVSKGKSSLIMGTIIFSKNFADNKDGAADKFLKRYEESVKFVNKDTKAASKLVEKYGIIPKATIANIAIPRCNIVYINAQKGKGMLDNFYNVLMKDNPKSIGGKLPDENFYYSEGKNN